jgi:anti-sigma regulatory factor (Ser/Thr protein kinase)
MNPPNLQIARLPERYSDGYTDHDAGPFHAYQRRAPFPRAVGGDPRPERAGPRIEVELSDGPSAAGEARAAIGVLSGRAEASVLDDVRLLVSEVVTNAVRHSGSPQGATIGLTVGVSPATVRAEVTDRGRGFEPAPRSAPFTQAGGWGLHLVDRLASRWGVDRGAPVRVWFEIDRT